MLFAVEKRLLCILNLYTCGILKLIKNVNHCKNTKNRDLTISCAILRRNWYSFWQAQKNLRMPTGKKSRFMDYQLRSLLDIIIAIFLNESLEEITSTIKNKSISWKLLHHPWFSFTELLIWKSAWKELSNIKKRKLSFKLRLRLVLFVIEIRNAN